MTGIFDSGAGGLAALTELRRICPTEDILFLADRRNAPYGTKSEDEILRLVKRNIGRLCSAGAERVLIACCTASTVYDMLSSDERSVAVPVIAPTAARAAEKTRNGTVAVIATERTVKSGAFGREIRRAGRGIRVSEYAAQELVEIAERRAHGHVMSKDERELLRAAVVSALEGGADTLVLGCTHFSHLQKDISEIVNGDIELIDAAKTGAAVIAHRAHRGGGATVFL